MGLNTYQWDINRIWFSIKVLNKYKNKTKKHTNKQRKNVKNKNKTKIIIHTVTFLGIVNVEKIYCDFFSCDFFFYRLNTYLRYYIEHRHYININSIVNDKKKIVNVKFPQKRKTIRFIIFVNGFRYTVAILLNAGLI